MATSTVEPPAGPQAVPAVKKDTRGGARPGAGRPKTKETEAEAQDSFWEWLDALAKDRWQNLICYLWRTDPVLDLSGGGKPITIEKIVRPFDSTYIYETHGSGGYRFDFA